MDLQGTCIVPQSLRKCIPFSARSSARNRLAYPRTPITWCSQKQFISYFKKITLRRMRPIARMLLIETEQTMFFVGIALSRSCRLRFYFGSEPVADRRRQLTYALDHRSGKVSRIFTALQPRYGTLEQRTYWK